MSKLGWIALWGIAGVLAILVDAVARLLPIVVDLADYTLAPAELAALIGWIVVMAIGEGWRGFHRQFSPRVVTRALHLEARRSPRWVIVLAPLYCMGLVYATRRRLLTSWILTFGIVALVVAVRELAQPWRGIVDAGVVVGLAIGTLSIVYFVVRAARGHAIPVAPDVPAD
jgi:hypothetical protein